MILLLLSTRPLSLPADLMVNRVVAVSSSQSTVRFVAFSTSSSQLQVTSRGASVAKTQCIPQFVVWTSCTGAGGAPRADCSLPMLRVVVHSQRPVRLSFIELVRVSQTVECLVLGVCTGKSCVYV